MKKVKYFKACFFFAFFFLGRGRGVKRGGKGGTKS